jgi:hypothetical protein
MASQTYFNLRKARKGLLLHELVARGTFQALLLMGLMVKLNGLLHPSPHDRGKKEDNYHDEKDDSRQKEPRFPLVTDEIIPTLMSPFFESIPDQGPHFFTVDKWPFGGKI